MTGRRYVECARFGGPEELAVVSGPVLAPRPGEVVIAVEAIGVNFADTMVRRGEYRRDQTLPHTPGMEVAGTISAVGAGCTLGVGAPVAVFMEHGGGYSSHVVAAEDLVFQIDLEIDPELVAASFLQGVTAWYAVHRYGGVKPSDSVLVSGAAGGLGTWIVQLAREAGATAVGLASSESKRSYLAELGCDATFDSYAPDLTRDLRTCRSGGFDVICDGVGGPLFAKLLPALARGGRYVVTGSASQEPAMLDTRHLMPRGQAIAGFVVRNVMDSDPREPAAALHEVLSRVADGRVRVDFEVLRMDEVVDAHRRIEARDVLGKIVLRP